MIDFGEGVQLDVLPEFSFAPWTWRNDPKIWRWTRQNDLIPLRHHKCWQENVASDDSIQMYAVLDGKNHIGVCGLTSIDLKNSHAEFSLYIAPDFQRKGFAKPALKTLFYHGFQNMRLRSIWGETFENNPAQFIFRAIGMKEDGVRRQFYWKDGRFWDAILFSILSEEFLSVHGVKSCF